MVPHRGNPEGSGVLAAGEDEADLASFEVDLNEGRLDQVGDVLQMNGGGLVLFVVLFYAGALRELSQFAAVDVDGDLAAKWLQRSEEFRVGKS